ncbi:Aminoacyl-tRNA synthetase, class II (D/K/N)-like protein [Metarhizium album ARSEF 1941]|uniref:asparagine--tRNA ligase n=1 Tax=Metarhizium album (strain ARSEF 1941) TaxID=1081103 RepID=A0A0B2X8H7_METAS|nr:Aminoacyl-tRNA synthetase, class II (D/K/N)-like protein [Metarhizium album ARSEF 1941]KHO02083.1 Aminoacyl-tRNA synthetase, class II (D/K/N)-like protein [Metarhizium album ARSEF 1941]
MRPTLLPKFANHRHILRILRSRERRYSAKVIDESQPTIKTAADLRTWHPETNVPDVHLCGWVRSVRKSSGVRFVDVTDGSSMRPVQAVVDKALAADIRPGSAVRLKGRWHNEAGMRPPSTEASAVSDTCSKHTQLVLGTDGMERGAERAPMIQELHVKEVEVLGVSDPQTYPIQNKYQTPETLRYISHLRSRTPLNSTLLRLRSDATFILTQFFFNEKFQQTHPPIITSSDCEGAGEAFIVKTGSRAEFFRDPKYLTVSAQLHLEALAQSLGNVWTLSPTFRAEQSDTSRHLSEFYMLEAEMSFVNDMSEVMDLVQKMLKYLAQGLKGLRAANELAQNRLDSRDPAERLAFADLVEQEELDRRWTGLLSPSQWPRIPYSEAIERLQSVANMFEHKPVWGSGLHSEHERYLAKEMGLDKANNAYLPIFITQYPRDIKAFYMLRSASPPAQGDTVDCFDLLVPSLGELAGGSMREHRLFELEENMKLHGLEVPGKRQDTSSGLGWYLDLRRWGCPPHGGFGLGFDRLLSYLTGVANVRDVVPFPRHYQRCDC